MMSEFKVSIQNTVFAIETVTNSDELEIIKKLDDFVFGNHQGINIEVLKRIFEQGGLLVFRHNSQIIGESQCILKSIKPIIILEKDTALFYGTAVHPDFQGNKIGSALFKAQEKVAINHGKKYAKLTIRPENNVSIILRLNMGYEIIGYDKNYFGNDSSKDGRLILQKELLGKKNEFNNSKLYKSQSISIKVGDEPDTQARYEIEKLFDEGYSVTTYKMQNHEIAIMTFK